MDGWTDGGWRVGGKAMSQFFCDFFVRMFQDDSVHPVL